MRICIGSKLAVQLGVKFSTRLRQCTERREIHTEKAEPLQHRVRIGDTGEVCDFFFPHKLPKTAVKERFLRHNNGSTDSEVRIQNRKPIDIVQRQIRNSTFIFVKIQILHNGLCICLEIIIALPHQLRAARRARCRHEDGKILVKRVWILLPHIVKDIAIDV